MYSVLPLTPLFTIACLGLVFSVWRQAAYLEFFNADWLIYTGSGFIAIAAWVGLFRRALFKMACDLFCLGSIGVWFVHWREVYRSDAPVFAWYPVFFVFLIVLLNWQVINKSSLLDPTQMRMVELIHSVILLHPLLLTSGVLLSVYFSEFYIFYPILLSLFLIHCSFAIVLQKSKSV